MALLGDNAPGSIFFFTEILKFPNHSKVFFFIWKNLEPLCYGPSDKERKLIMMIIFLILLIFLLGKHP